MDNLDEIIGKYKSLDEHLRRLEAEQENKSKCIQPTFHKSVPCPYLSKNDLIYYSTAQMNVVQQNLAQDKDKGKTFFEVLSAFIDAKNMKDSDCYKKAGVSKQSFSDYRGGTIPETEVIVRFALALDLDLDETERLLRAAGRAFSFEPRDKFIVACIKAGIKDVDDVNEALYDWGYKTFQFVKEK